MTAGVERPLIAVVDDEPFVAELVGGMLSSAGVDMELFTLGSKLLRSANLLKFKSIILDLSLPDIDGFEVMDRLAADSVAVSVLLMSGHDLAVVRAAKIYGNGIGLKMRGALTKPFTRGELFTALGLQE